MNTVQAITGCHSPGARRRRHARIEPGGLVRLLAGIETGIEPRQAQRAAHGQRERGDPSKSWCGLKRPEEENQRRSRPESNIVRQRIELGAKLALCPQQPRDASVESV